MIRGIIFDCFGVLYHGSLGHLRELAPPARLKELNDLSHSYDYGYITQAEYFDHVGQLIGRSAEEVDVISREQHFRSEPMVQLARELHGDYKTALLSNIGRGFIERLFTAKEREELFDTEVLSNEVNLMKPDKAIYHLVASMLDIQPSECIMIDDLPINVDGATGAGMHGILYESPEQTRQEIYQLIKDLHA